MTNNDKKKHNEYQNGSKELISDNFIEDKILQNILNRFIKGFVNKPDHWTDLYWETIKNNFKWFLFKEGNVGCAFCYKNTSFSGKKSLIGSMKLGMMELSYEDFERKLEEHKSSIQHNRALAFYAELLNHDHSNVDLNIICNFDSPPVPQSMSVRIPAVDIFCPLCRKNYKLKKALVKHIYFCNNEQSTNGFIPPCGCRGCILFSICAIDEHNSKIHKSKYLFNCKKCEEQYRSATDLYGHLLLYHDYQWNPYNEMPIITETAINQQLNAIHDDRKNIYSTLDEILLRYDKSESVTMNSLNKVNDIKSMKRRKSLKDEVISDNKIEKKVNNDKREVSHLMLSIDQIYTCEFCGGRYLSINILNEHINSRHLNIIDNMENSYEHQRKYNKKPSTTFDSQIKTTETESVTIKQDYLKSKMDDVKSSGTQNNKISACQLSCPICQESFVSLDERNIHVSRQHPEIQQFICQHCGLIFTTLINYNRHVEKSEHTNLLPKLNKSNAITTYSCDFCVLVFTNHADLSHHVNLSHPLDYIKPLTEIEENTDACGANDLVEESIPCNTANFLSGLIEADFLENRCSCFICGFISHNPFELQVHSLTHNDNNSETFDLPSCPSCSRLFFGEFSKLYLKDHYNVEHLKKPAPQCNLCKMFLSSSYCLEKHLKSGKPCPLITNDDPYYPLMVENKFAFSCSQCGSIFGGENSKSRLEAHSKTCTSELMDEDEFLDN